MADESRGIPDKQPKEKDAHTQRIAFERAIMEMTGANRSQIRNAAIGTPLRDFIVRAQGGFGAGVAAPVAPVAPPPPPQIIAEQQTFVPQPLLQGAAAPREAQQQPAATGNLPVRAVQLQDDGSYLAGTATVNSFVED